MIVLALLSMITSAAGLLYIIAAGEERIARQIGAVLCVVGIISGTVCLVLAAVDTIQN